MTISRTDTLAGSVLLIEADPLMLTVMGSVLNSAGHRATLARTETIAVDAIATGQFDVLVLSIEEVAAGCQFAARLRSQPATVDTPIIFLVPHLDPATSEQLASQGGVFSMLKPIQPDSLIDLVEKALWLPHVALSHHSPHSASTRPAPAAAGGLGKPTASDWTRL